MAFLSLYLILDTHQGLKLDDPYLLDIRLGSGARGTREGHISMYKHLPLVSLCMSKPSMYGAADPFVVAVS
jgi:hypothetical protein